MRELGEKAEIDDTFPDEHVLAASHDLISQFADFANYLATCYYIRGRSSAWCEKVLLG